MSVEPRQKARSLDDRILGCFAKVAPSETVDHLVRYLGTWSGSDKMFMVVQYALKLIVPFLHLRARLQHRAGLRQAATSHLASNYAKLAGMIGESRRLWGLWGLLPIYQWLISIERTNPATRSLLNIERLQGWAMLLFFPLEHLSYLRSSGVIPASFPSPFSLFSSKKRRININTTTLGLWSCRLWGAYVLLQFAHLYEDRKLILREQRQALKNRSSKSVTVEETTAWRQRWDAFWSDVVINIGYFPLTIHWSLENGLFTNDAYVAAFGLVAAVASFRSGWKATAVHSTPPMLPSEKDDAEDSKAELSSGYMT